MKIPNILTTTAPSMARLILTITAFFLASLIPVIGVFFLAVLPGVLFVLSMVNDPEKVIPALAFSAGGLLIILSAVASGWPVFALAAMAAAGVLAAHLTRNQYSIEAVIGFACLFVLAMLVVFLMITGMRVSVSPWDLVHQYIRESVEINIRLYSRLPLGPEEQAAIQAGKDGIVALFTKIFPALCFIAVAGTLWLNILAGRRMLARLNSSAHRFEPLSHWMAPSWLVWIFIAAGIAIFLPAEKMNFAGINLFLAAAFLYFLQGLAIVSFYFQARKTSAFLRGLAYFLIAVQQILMLAIALIGFLDIWIDFRKHLRQSESPS